MTKRISASLLLTSALLLAGSLSAAVNLPSIVGDGMVLQRNEEIEIWGWADPGEDVEVRFRGEQYTATADHDGNWQVTTKPLKAGGPYKMVVEGRNRITLDNVLVGDVWLCSGQSNMTHAFNRWQERYAEEIAAASNPEIRQFHVPTNPVLTGPRENVPDLNWKQATPENVLDFTVVGYFFAKALHDKYGVPQGIINSSVGGTPIEAWTSEEGFRQFPEKLETIERNKDAEYVQRVNAEAKADRESDGPRVEADKGLTGPVKWYDPAYEPRNWKRIAIPGYWEDQGIRDLNGVVWYRRQIEIPESMAGQEAQVKLGRIRNADTLYVNGEQVGSTGYEYPQRRYTIPAGVLEPGKNLFVVRVDNPHGKGGFIPDKPYYLDANGQRVDLKGYWQYKVGEVYRPQRQYKQGISAQSQPAALYNGMIAPFTDYAIRGILWYQGESNAGDPAAYRELLPNLIEDWRQQWGEDDIVFLIAQLPNYMDVDYLPAESNWALMREAQMETAETMPHTGVGINIELGEWNDIHPADKKTVGERLALQAMKLSYGEENIVASGPTFSSQKIKDGKIILSFDNVGSGLVSSDGEELSHFAIAGEDKQFVWANARIQGDQVVVWSDEVPNPKYVRYAWADNPDFANLANEEGLPAAPFRTEK